MKVSKISFIREFVLGTDILDQQVSCLWQGKNLLSVSLSGFINYLDESDNKKPIKVIKGHNKSITAMTIKKDPGSNHNTIYTGSFDGVVCHWDAETGDNEKVGGVHHTNQVSDMSQDVSNIYTCGLDDTVRTLSLQSNEYINQVKMDSQPRGVACINDVLIVAGFSDLTVLTPSSGAKKSVTPVKFEPSCVDVHPVNGDVAVGGGKDSKVHVYSLSGNNLVPKKDLDHRDSITDVKYSPDGTYLAASDASRRVVLYKADTLEVSKLFDTIDTNEK